MISERSRRMLPSGWVCLCSAWLWSCEDSKPPAAGGGEPSAAVSGEDKTLTEISEPPEIHVAAHDPRTHSPVDATPSPDGSRIYYLASARDELGEDSAGVFTTAADGGGMAGPDTLARGTPLLAPVGITTSLDGEQLFIADSSSGPDATGALYALARTGGTPSLVTGSEGYRPAGLTVARIAEEELLVFTGSDPETGAAGVFTAAVGGGTVRALALGGPLTQPGGVAVSTSGDVYVADNTEHGARIVRIRDGHAEVFVSEIGLGYPAGVTLTRDASTLIVSGLDPMTKHDVVYFVATATGKLSRLTQGVGAFSEAAGLHRAHDRDLFAWADSRADISGTVYVLQP